MKLLSENIFNFRQELVKFLEKDEMISRNNCSVNIIPKLNPKYPYLIVSLKNYKNKNFNDNLIEIEGNISIFSRDKTQNQLGKIISRIENILPNFDFKMLNCHLLSLKLDDYSIKVSDDNMTSKLSANILALISFL